mmetsp:Transcript_160413/g.510449  ORF Transcript_160413/g.510449 Transcript_160413/m.510449 type:complete len:262 (-) Transcript_160413:972-1757(-)
MSTHHRRTKSSCQSSPSAAAGRGNVASEAFESCSPLTRDVWSGDTSSPRPPNSLAAVGVQQNVVPNSLEVVWGEVVVGVARAALSSSMVLINTSDDTSTDSSSSDEDIHTLTGVKVSTSTGTCSRCRVVVDPTAVGHLLVAARPPPAPKNAALSTAALSSKRLAAAKSKSTDFKDLKTAAESNSCRLPEGSNAGADDGAGTGASAKAQSPSGAGRSTRWPRGSGGGESCRLCGFECCCRINGKYALPPENAPGWSLPRGIL